MSDSISNAPVPASLIPLDNKIPKLIIPKLDLELDPCPSPGSLINLKPDTNHPRCTNCYIVIRTDDDYCKPKQFAELIDEDNDNSSPNVAQVLEFMFKISSENKEFQLLLQDDLDLYLCWNCSTNLSTLYKLFMEFMNASQIPSGLSQVFQAKVQNFQNNWRVHDDNDFQKVDHFMLPIKVEIDEESSKYGALDLSKQSNRSGRRTGSKVHGLGFITKTKNPKSRKRSNSNTKLYDCPQCPAQFKHHSFVRQHVLNKHKYGTTKSSIAQFQNKEMKPKLPLPKLTIACPVCRKLFETNECLQLHLTSKHIPSIRVKDQKCEECGKLFWTQNDVNYHVRSIHSTTNLQECDQCDFKTRRPQELKRHKKMKHLQEKNFYCSVCNKGYTLQWQLKLHEKIHQDDRTYICTFEGCDKAFRAPSNLRQHAEMHKGSKYICHICGNSYSRKAYLSIHLNMRHLGLPLPPSLSIKRDGNPSVPKKPRVPKLKVTEEIQVDEEEKIKKLKQFRNPKFKQDRKVFKELETEENYFILPHDNLEVLVGNSSDEVLILEEFVPEDHDKIEILNNSDLQLVTTIENTEERNTLDLVQENDTDSTTGPIDESKPTQELTLIDGQKIICYTDIGNIQRIIDVQSGSNNTYYIATACSQNPETSEEEGPSSENTIGILPFSDFMSNLK